MKKFFGNLIFIFSLITLLSVTCSCTNLSTDNLNDENDTEICLEIPAKITPEFNPSSKTIKYKELPNYGYADGLDYFDEFYYMSFGNSMEDVKDTIDIDEKYITDGGEPGLVIDEKTLEYDYWKNYQKSIRRSGDWMITDFEDGICVNEYVFDEKNYNNEKNITIEIPDTLDGKKVLKIGSCVKRWFDNEISFQFEHDQIGILSSVPSAYEVTLVIPKTVSDISSSAFYSFYYWLDEPEDEETPPFESADVSCFVVNNDNPFYSSNNGSLYNKDKSCLLYICPEKGKDFIVPDSVNTIISRFAYFWDNTIVIGKNVKKIYDEEISASDDDPLRFKVYKNSYTDKFLHNNGYIDDNHIEYIK